MSINDIINKINALIMDYSRTYTFKESAEKKLTKIIFKTLNLDNYRKYKNMGFYNICNLRSVNQSGLMDTFFSKKDFNISGGTYYINGHTFDVTSYDTPRKKEVREVNFKDEHITMDIIKERLLKLEQVLQKVIKSKRRTLMISAILLSIIVLLIIGVCVFAFTKNIIAGVVSIIVAFFILTYLVPIIKDIIQFFIDNKRIF